MNVLIENEVALDNVIPYINIKRLEAGFMNMNSKIKAAVLLLALTSALPVFAQDKSPLVGAWRMTKLEVASGGKLQPVPYSGQLIVTEAGTLSAQAMDPDPNAAGTPYTTNGYEALYGTVVINDSTNTFITTVQSALVRSLIGQKMERSFSISGNRMVMTPVDQREGFRVTYERY